MEKYLIGAMLSLASFASPAEDIPPESFFNMYQRLECLEDGEKIYKKLSELGEQTVVYGMDGDDVMMVWVGLDRATYTITIQAQNGTVCVLSVGDKVAIRKLLIQQGLTL